MTRKKKVVIKVPFGNITKIAEGFGVRRSTVSMALNFASDSQLAHNIRDRALKLYGGKLCTITVE